MSHRQPLIKLSPIGIIRTPHLQQAGTPIQPFAARDVAGEIEVSPDFRSALQDLEGFDRIWVLYWFHQAKPFTPKVTPYRDVVERGLFATHAPSRPDHLGLSAVRLVEVKVEAGLLKVLDVDMLNGTPLLDIKPYAPKFDCYPASKAGRLNQVGSDQNLADGRFTKSNEP